MSTTALSVRSNNSSIDVRSTRKATNHFAYWEPEALTPDDPEPEPEPEPSSAGSQVPGRRTPGSLAQGTEAEGGYQSPPAVSREGSKLLSRRSSSTSRSRHSRASGASSASSSRKSSALGYVEGGAAPGAGDPQGFQHQHQEQLPFDGRREADDWEATEQQPEVLQRRGGPAGLSSHEEAARQHRGPHAGFGPASKSERSSRSASAAGSRSPEPEANGGAAPSTTAQRDGPRRSTQTPTALSHRSHASNSPGAAGVAGGGGGKRLSAAALELQDLPPDALPWSEPPEYVSHVSSTVSVNNDPGVGTVHPQPPSGLSRETSRTSNRAPSEGAANIRNSSTGHKSAGHGHGKTPVPMLPLRELAAAAAAAAAAAGVSQSGPSTPTEPAPPPAHPSLPIQAPPAAAAVSSSRPPPAAHPSGASVPMAEAAAVTPPQPSREASRTSVRAGPSTDANGHSMGTKAPSGSHRSMLEITSHPLVDPDLGSPAVTPSGALPLEPPEPVHESPRPPVSREGSRVSRRPSSANSANSVDRKTPFARKSATDWHQDALEQLPWVGGLGKKGVRSAVALAEFRSSFKKASILLSDPAEEPLTARLDAVFALPPELWPVLPAGALYCLEAADPRATFQYMQHRDFPDTKVRVNTYFGKWGRHLVDFVVSWQPTPRAEAAWQLEGGKQPPLPWEQRQVVAHTTNGEYQYANTRMRFRGPKSTEPDSGLVEYCDAHGVDLLDTKAANETAPRNSDKDREAHLVDPPRPNTWGELARRPLISNLRSRGGGAYVHHVTYDYSSLRTSCGRRVPAGYFFTLAPNASPRTPPVPGNSAARSSSVGRSLAGGLRANGDPSSSMRIRSVNGPVQALLSTFGESISSSKWGAYVGGASTVNIGAAPASVAGSRPSSAGPCRRPESAVGGRLPHLQNSCGPSELGTVRSAWSSIGVGGGLVGVGVSAVSAAGVGAPQREGSRLAAPASPTLVGMAPKQRWRTYDVPFNHPIHSTRAQELGADMAVASGRGVRTFSDAAAVLQIAEQELRLPRAFVPGPVVVPRWEDIPRLYAEHMEAARGLMPVTELDMYGSSKLHMLIYHLQCAATLEYDRLDAKLLLLPQMARLGCKSVEIDAWLQVLIEHAVYLYDKLDITDRARWRPAVPTERLPMRRSVTFAKAAALANPNSSSWNFPDPLVSTSFASRSALNVAAQPTPPVPTTQLPAASISMDEWAAINRVMDTCRHAVLHDHWVRLRPVMTGTTTAGNRSYSSSRAGSMIGSVSDACATASGEGDRPALDPDDPYSHGAVNRELLDYMHRDLEAMSSPDYVAPVPATGKKIKQRGYRGEGPLPPELVAEMPTVHRPVRCRGADETPLPPEFQKMDLWNVKNKAEQIDLTKFSPEVARDAGALRFSQAAKGFADSRQAEIRRSMQRARGITVFDDSDVPEYGSDVADDDVASIATSMSINTVDGRPRRRRRPSGPIQKVEPVVPGIACQTMEEEMPSAELGVWGGAGERHWPQPQELRMREEAELRVQQEAAEARRLLLTGNGGKTREQMLDDCLRAAESAIESLKPRPLGAIAPSEAPDSPNTYFGNASVDTMEHNWRPSGRGPGSQGGRSSVFAPVRPPGGGAAAAGAASGPQDSPKRGPQDSSSRKRGTSSVAETYGRGPEPFSLEKLTAEPSVVSESDIVTGDVPKASSFGGVSTGIGGLVDYETAMARRRAVAGAEVALCRSNFIPKSEVMNLFVTYCNLGGHPELIEMLQKAVEAPVSTVTVSAVSKAVRAATRNATTGRMDVDSEATRQRIRGTAWLLGVTWRRITNETYTSFLCRVLGWPADLCNTLNRTRATQVIARALVRGHDMTSVPRPGARGH
ncbi:hypothetical protein VOLCADRAFT_92248 [Volvox carteri f. nagariensis]|uniref:Uncharacterized protein n=1 Tax=Volvox carteri f. nagariensis TaxID=3068 RepID=D8TZ56_VOLCA|nr:uncharacterized protein VOLCADRAFT_92248 [Volvox carteri f. nagariensis]EFJ47219.1 hypothetical protein VOLCADRAFT_92248 [Volvox carteri f. nagariensis]|eukprot:XP_002951768.1 hypothetical protein VOLCADRAFT_92248 [Volvox carteri f. nagariensis]